MNYLDRNEFNFEPSQLVVDTIKNFDIRKFAFYTRIYDQGKKSIFSVYLSEQFHIDEQQVLVGYGAEDLLKKAVHYFLTKKGSNGIMMIPKFSWWYYSNIADEVEGQTIQYNVIETDDTFKYDFEALERQVNEVRQKFCSSLHLTTLPATALPLPNWSICATSCLPRPLSSSMRLTRRSSPTMPHTSSISSRPVATSSSAAR